MRFLLLSLPILLFATCKPKEQSVSTEVKDSIESKSDSIMASTPKAKLESFNRVDQAIDKLSAIGIGKMSEWKSAGSEFTSYTPPFAIDEKKMNDVSFAIESTDRNYINSFKVILNIGNPKESRQALAKLKEVTTKAFETLEIQMPTPFPNALLNTQQINIDGVDYGTSLRVDSTKVPSWVVRVTTRVVE